MNRVKRPLRNSGFTPQNNLRDTEELHRYVSKGQELVRRELGNDNSDVKPTLLMQEMLDNVKHGMQTGESDIEKIVLDESLSLQLKENTFQLNTNEEPSATGSLKWSNVVLFRAMRQALRSSGLMPAAI